MSNSFFQTSRIEALYARALRLYPRGFQEAYGSAMQQAFRDALMDQPQRSSAFYLRIASDLLTSLIKEHTTMLRETYFRPVLVYNALVLSGIATLLGLALYAIPQTVLRLGAEDPQLQLADDLAARLEQGTTAANAVPATPVDLNRSLAPFVMAFDADGRPLASQAALDGAIPVPPRGVFDYVRTHGIDRITWQPRRGLRIATIIQRVDGPKGGYVVAGRSMRIVEDRIDKIEEQAGLVWLGMLGIIFFGTLLFGWYTRPQQMANVAEG